MRRGFADPSMVRSEAKAGEGKTRSLPLAGLKRTAFFSRLAHYR